MPKGDKFTVGDLVFGKVKGYPPWPARIISMASKDRYKIYFYGTYETASLKNEDIWIYNADNKEKFASKNMKRKGYPEGMDQLENNPEIAGIEDDVPLSDLKSTPTVSSTTPAIADSKSKKAQSAAKDTPSGRSTPKSTAVAAKDTPERTTTGEKRKAAESTPTTTATTSTESNRKAQKKSVGDDVKTRKGSSRSDDSQSEDEKSTSRSGRSIGKSSKKVDLDNPSSPAVPSSTTETKSGRRSKVTSSSSAEGKENSSPSPRSPVKNLSSPSGKENTNTEEDKARKLEKRKNKLRWLKMEQRLVELDIAVKSSLHLERPSPERCISALEELNELAIVPFMLKKQPDIVTTVRRLRKYIGPHSFSSWSDEEAKKRMEKSIDIIQKKADQIYNKFKSYFAYQGEKTFSTMFEEEVEHFKKVTKGMDEGKVLSMIRDPTVDGNISDED
eukprot:TRINITY_DN386_c0_g1_i5.p1 TRINITY_DN386_c0_g1~~TRINITY_DN386_c0_g1_i5.p1  ORF type:complete len:445 (+),score=124.00 TRINITY_DN386_c0_g1_i5:59-1393(+)